MSKYVSLFDRTEQGVKNYRDTVDRADAAQKLASDMVVLRDLLDAR